MISKTSSSPAPKAPTAAPVTPSKSSKVSPFFSIVLLFIDQLF